MASPMNSTDHSDRRSINVCVVQSGNADYFSIVETTNWHEGTWSKNHVSDHTLNMNGPDVSGMLRFKSSGVSEHEEFFLVALGVDGSKPWCDLKVNAKDTDTAAFIHHRYYNTDDEEYKHKKQHNPKVSLTSKNKTEITVQYYTDDKKVKGGDKLRGFTITIT
jgi:hypothetical protein